MAESKLDSCVEMKCPAGELRLPAIGKSPAMSLRLPPTKVSSSTRSFARVPCCQGVISSTGSCEGPDARLSTWVPVQCGSDGTWANTTRKEGNTVSPDILIGSCNPHNSCCPDDLLQYAQTDAPTATAAWRSFQSLIQAQWLPVSGQLMAISVAVAGGPLKPVFAAHNVLTEGTSKGYVLDSTLSETDSDTARGRSAAAFARVACRQFGFKSAPVVTTCRALAKAAAAANDTSNAAWALSTAISQVCQLPAEKKSRGAEQKCAAAPFAVHMYTDRQGGPTVLASDSGSNFMDLLC